MTSHEAFRFGMLMQCADEGLDENETHERLVKAAALLKMSGTFSDMIKALSNVGTALGRKAFWVGAAGPPILGLGGGWAASKLTSPDYDKESVRTDEEIAEYQRAIDKLRRARLLHSRT